MKTEPITHLAPRVLQDVDRELAAAAASTSGDRRARLAFLRAEVQRLADWFAVALPPVPRLFTPEQACEYLLDTHNVNTSPKTLQRRAASGELEAVKQRFHRDSLDRAAMDGLFSRAAPKPKTHKRRSQRDKSA